MRKKLPKKLRERYFNDYYYLAVSIGSKVYDSERYNIWYDKEDIVNEALMLLWEFTKYLNPKEYNRKQISTYINTFLPRKLKDNIYKRYKNWLYVNSTEINDSNVPVVENDYLNTFNIDDLKYLDDMQRKILKHIMLGYSVKESLKELNLTRSTYYAKRKAALNKIKNELQQEVKV